MAYYAYNCSNLTSIIFPSGLTNIGEYAFDNCIKLSNIKIPDSVTKIGQYAFRGCSKMTGIILPNTIKELCFDEFYETRIEKLTIPASVEIVRYSAFSNTRYLKTILIEDGSHLTTLEYESLIKEYEGDRV